MDRGACRAGVHGVPKSQTRLSDQHATQLKDIVGALAGRPLPMKRSARLQNDPWDHSIAALSLDPLNRQPRICRKCGPWRRRGGLSASGEPLAVQTGPPLGCLPLLWLRTKTGERFRSLPMMICKCTDGFRALYSQRRSQE